MFRRMASTTSRTIRSHNRLIHVPSQRVRSHDASVPQVVPPQDATGGVNGDKIVIVMVGLPGCGKTFIAQRLARYLLFFQNANVKVFGDPSDDVGGELPPALCTFMEEGDESARLGRVAIFDATNHRRQGRRRLWEQGHANRWKVIFLESQLRDDGDSNVVSDMLRQHALQDSAQHGLDFEAVLAQYKEKREAGLADYEEMGGDERKFHWIRIVDKAEQVQINRIDGYLPGRVVQFVMNLHFGPQRLYFTRHGQSVYNTTEQIGGDSGLSEAGEAYATALAEFAQNTVPPDDEYAESWTQMDPRVWRNLDEIYAGVCDGMTYKEIESNYPAEFEARKLDKLGYRYPRGESYLDVIQRLDPIVQEIHRCKQPLMVVGHQGILRILYAYFMGYEREKAPKLSIPLNTVICLETTMWEAKEERKQLIPPAAVSNVDAPSI